MQIHSNEVMSKLTCLIVIFAVFSTICDAAIFKIDQDKYLGFEEFEDSIPQIDSIIIQSSNIQKYFECGERFPGTLSVVSGGIFKDLPCVKMYYLGSVVSSPDTRVDPILCILYNNCDSSIYHFGGDTYRFSLVVRKYLNDNFNDDGVVRLLEFYLDTIDPNDPYYLINSIDDYNSACNNYLLNNYQDSVFYYGTPKYKKDQSFVSNYVHPLKLVRENCSVRVEFYSWNQSFGDLEFWCFVVTKEYIQIVERRLLCSELGPYNERFWIK